MSKAVGEYFVCDTCSKRHPTVFNLFRAYTIPLGPLVELNHVPLNKKLPRDVIANDFHFCDEACFGVWKEKLMSTLTFEEGIVSPIRTMVNQELLQQKAAEGE